MMRDGTDVTAEYQKGAQTALYLAKTLGADFAILKANSPSCGKGMIYDGTFTGETEAISDGYFHESEYRSAPYFDIQIDGITIL